MCHFSEYPNFPIKMCFDFRNSKVHWEKIHAFIAIMQLRKELISTPAVSQFYYR